MTEKPKWGEWESVPDAPDGWTLEVCQVLPSSWTGRARHDDGRTYAERNHRTREGAIAGVLVVLRRAR